MNKPLHINCDMAESYGNFRIGRDQELIPYIDACNLACGFHGGDAASIESTLMMAIKAGKEIGAHPSYPDLAGFGRRYMDIPFDELKSILNYQIAVIKGLTEHFGGKLSHIKAHGALYNQAMIAEKEALAIAEVVNTWNPEWEIFVQPSGMLQEVAQSKGLRVRLEAFADRVYTENGKLKNRNQDGSIIHQPESAWEQVQLLLTDQVKTDTGKIISMPNSTICIHGDHPHALDIVRFIRSKYLSD